MKLSKDDLVKVREKENKAFLEIMKEVNNSIEFPNKVDLRTPHKLFMIVSDEFRPLIERVSYIKDSWTLKLRNYKAAFDSVKIVQRMKYSKLLKKHLSTLDELKIRSFEERDLYLSDFKDAEFESAVWELKLLVDDVTAYLDILKTRYFEVANVRKDVELLQKLYQQMIWENKHFPDVFPEGKILIDKEEK